LNANSLITKQLKIHGVTGPIALIVELDLLPKEEVVNQQLLPEEPLPLAEQPEDGRKLYSIPEVKSKNNNSADLLSFI
jgi:hypothetical protein